MNFQYHYTDVENDVLRDRVKLAKVMAMRAKNILTRHDNREEIENEDFVLLANAIADFER